MDVGQDKVGRTNALMVVTENFVLRLAQGLGWGFFSGSPKSLKLKFSSFSSVK